MDVAFYEVFSEEQNEIERRLNLALKGCFFERPIQEYRHSELKAPVISIRTQSVIPEEWEGELQGILTRSTGHDHLRDWAGRGVPCGYLPDYCGRAVAEHALGVMLALLKRLKKQMRQFSSFDRNGITGLGCLGKRLLVVGVGKIGTEMVRLGQGVGMEVKGVDLVHHLSDLEYVALVEGIAWADVIVCALSLTPETERLLNLERLQSACPGALFINVSRGEISPIRDLSKLLDAGVLGGVSLDVFDDEAPLASALQQGMGPEEILAFGKRDDVILTPHNAFNTEESLARKSEQSCLALSHFIEKRVFPYAVPTMRDSA